MTGVYVHVQILKPVLQKSFNKIIFSNFQRYAKYLYGYDIC